MIANPDAEAALWAAIVDDNELLDELELQPRDFSNLVWRFAYAAALALRAEGKLVDPISVADKVNDEERMSAMVLSEPLVLNQVPGPKAQAYVDIIRHHSLSRRVLHELTEAIDDCRSRGYGGRGLLDKALQRLTAIDCGTDGASIPIGVVVRERMREIEERLANPGMLDGVATGLAALDEHIGGLPLGLATVVCGRPGHGKSTLAMHIAAHASQETGVHVFSLEDPRSMYADRVLAHTSGTPAENIRNGSLDRGQMGDLATAIAAVHDSKWLYQDIRRVTAADVVRAVRQKRRENDTQLVIVDYLTLLAPPDAGLSRFEAVSTNMHILADAAKSDHMAYLVLSQLNRKCEERPDKRPRVGDLRQSGEIEERAKLILACYRGSLHGGPKKGVDYECDWEKPQGEDWNRRLSLLVLKNTNGSLGVANFEFDGQAMCIR